MEKEKIADMLENVRCKKPLVHCITNYVTAGVSANALLAVGASPIMACDICEVSCVASLSKALVINMGTLTCETLKSMTAAGKRSNELGRPVILDPVGVGASPFRLTAARKLMSDIHFSVVRGNVSEIKALFCGSESGKGVDADTNDSGGLYGNVSDTADLALKMSRECGAVIIATGSVDIVSSQDKVCLVKNGHPKMSLISGTGCMLSAVLGAFCGANDKEIFCASIAAVGMMGLCGELAYEKTKEQKGGTGTLASFFMDEISLMSPERLLGGIKIEF